MKQLHLDSEYRNRWIEFYLANGTVEDSRLKNWRHVAWDQVVQVTAHLLHNAHTVTCKNPGFKAFMNFRWAGRQVIRDNNGKSTRQPIKIWTIGWTDGSKCFLKDINFYTGLLIKDYEAPLSEFRAHIHPAVLKRLA